MIFWRLVMQTSKLHIVHGGIENGDRDWLIKAAHKGLTSNGWTVPKCVIPGDAVVIYVEKHGFFATAIIDTEPKRPKRNSRRYRADLGSITLIEPPIPLSSIKKRLPKLDWAKYPRSICTPDQEIAKDILKLLKYSVN
jgi:hypothetical protein